MAKKVAVKVVKVRVYPLLYDSLEGAVLYGWNRAHKHSDNPGPDKIQEDILQAVMNNLSEFFDFGDEDD